MDDVVSRRNVRHMLLRRRNERIAQLRDERMPSVLRMNQRTLEELLMDSDPAEQYTLDFEGFEFLGVPIVTDPRVIPGSVEVDWPPVEVSGG